MKIIDHYEEAGYITIPIDIEEKTFTNSKNEEKNLLKEHQIHVYIQNILAMKIVCTPSHLSALLLGHIYSEGIISSVEDVEEIKISSDGKKGYITLKENPIGIQETVEINSCNQGPGGTFGRTEGALFPLNSVKKFSYTKEELFLLAKVFKQGAPLYKKTHAIHSGMLLYKKEILFFCEDIGRHNALDKIVGKALINHIPLEETIVFTSGRMPVDMVKKAIRAKIGLLASNTMPTYEAVKLAEKYGLSLMGKVREEYFEIYTW